MKDIREDPFENIWESFDKKEFQDRLLEAIDGFIESTDDEVTEEYLEEIDTLIMGIMILKETSNNNLEVIDLCMIPHNILFELGIDAADKDLIENGCIPISMLDEETLAEIEAYNKKKKRKSTWLKED